jgi:hypothetical protein
MDNNSEIDGAARLGQALGEWIGDLMGALITLGITGCILTLTWNYGLCEVVDVHKMKYYQSFLIILGWRSLTFKKGK